MNALITRSANRLYKVFKVYTTLAILGALASIVVQIMIAEPVILIATFMIAAFALSALLLWAQSRGIDSREFITERLEYERPPRLPESLMMASLPVEIADYIIGDVTREYYRLRSKYGRSSAVTWYTIQSATIFIRATALHFGLSRDKSFTQFLKKES